MLYLTVKPGEDVIIDDERIVVSVVSTHLLTVIIYLQYAGYPQLNREFVGTPGHAEIIDVGNPTTVVIRGITPCRVRLGFIAEPEVTILRRKVYERIMGTQKETS